jgi:hypothetical protein
MIAWSIAIATSRAFPSEKIPQERLEIDRKYNNYYRNDNVHERSIGISLKI